MAMLSINETTTFRWSFEEDVARYAASGIRAIGLWRHKLSDCGRERGQSLLAENQLAVSHLFWAGGFTGSDGRSFRDSLEDAREALATAVAMKTKNLIVYSGAKGGHTFNHARRLFRDALTALLPEAEALGITLALEPMHSGCADQCTFLTDLDETLAFIESIAHPNLKIVFDTYHLGFREDILAKIPRLVPQVALVQLGDGRRPPQGEQNRCLLGEGVLPLKEIVAAFRMAGYDGYYDVELIGEDVETYGYLELIDHAKKTFAMLLGGGL